MSSDLPWSQLKDGYRSLFQEFGNMVVIYTQGDYDSIKNYKQQMWKLIQSLELKMRYTRSPDKLADLNLMITRVRMLYQHMEKTFIFENPATIEGLPKFLK